MCVSIRLPETPNNQHTNNRRTKWQKLKEERKKIMLKTMYITKKNKMDIKTHVNVIWNMNEK